MNAIDYNSDRDEILLNTRSKGELLIIDHSTTSEEAKTNTGGKSGFGGQLLLRWGNPEAYGMGDPSGQKMFGSHGHNWIKKGLPNEGNILFFNNGDLRPEGKYSTVDMIMPAIDVNGEYVVTDNLFQLDNHKILYGDDQKEQPLYSQYMSNAQQLANGHLMINEGDGNIYEIDNEGNIVLELDPHHFRFEAFSYSRDYAGFESLDLTPISYGNPAMNYDNLNLCVDTVKLRSIPIPGNITWSNGDTTESIVISEEGLYSYAFESTSGEECNFTSQEIIVRKNENLYVDISKTSEFLCMHPIELGAKTAYETIVWSTGETTNAIFIENLGSFYYDAYDYCLDSFLRSDILTFEELQNPESNIFETSLGEDVVLSVLSLFPVVHWYDSADIEIEPIAEGNSFNLPMVLQDTTFWVAWGEDATCLSDRIPMYVKIKTNSTLELKEHPILLKPNPISRSELLFIETEGAFQDIMVIDIYGRSFDLKGTSDRYNLDHLLPGIYVLVGRQEGALRVGKIVVE